MAHLPECELSNNRIHCQGAYGWFSEHFSGENRCTNCGANCICGALQACEQRVIAQNDKEWAELSSISDGFIFEDGWREGYESALDLVEVVIQHHHPRCPEFACELCSEWDEIYEGVNKLREAK